MQKVIEKENVLMTRITALADGVLLKYIEPF